METTPRPRLITLQGGHNLRDIGGYATTDGRETRWGMVFRSGHLAGLTRTDRAVVASLRIRTVIDLRDDLERSSERSRLPDGDGISVRHFPLLQDRSRALEMQRKIMKGQLTRDDSTSLLTHTYRELVLLQVDTLRSLFDALADAAIYPALIHCSAGKDRTGLVVALLLLALRVPMDTVVEDYLLSTAQLTSMREQTKRRARIFSLWRADVSGLDPLFEARLEYFEAAIDAITGAHGSLAAYLESLGLDERRRQALAGTLTVERSLVDQDRG